MAPALILAAQAAVAAAAAPVAPIDFDLARLPRADSRQSRRCAATDGDSILVCGVRGGRGAYPLDAMERLFAARPLIAETRLFGNVTANANLTAVPMDRGAVSNRARITFSLPF